MGKLALLILLLAPACFACGTILPDPSAGMERYVGDYCSEGGSLAFLSLKSDGRYQCIITPGGSDGCLSTVGTGLSRGEWVVVDEVLSFNVLHEPSGLVTSMEGATGMLAGEVLLVTADGYEFRFSSAEYP